MSDDVNPTPAPGWPTAPPGETGETDLKVGFPEVRLPAPPGKHPAHRAMIAAMLIGLAGVALVFVLVDILAAPAPPRHCKRLECQGPPIGGPGSAQRGSAAPYEGGVLYKSQGGLTLRYLKFSSSIPAVKSTPHGILLAYHDPTGGTADLQVFGQPAGTKTPQSIVQAVIGQIAPSAQPVYQVPGAMIGYQQAYGEAFDVQSASSSGSAGTTRVIVFGAVVHNYGIAVIASGTRQDPVTPTSQLWNGHPSPADVTIAYIADPIVNSITFPGSSGR